MDLTPKQLHYFKRQLLSLQLREELDVMLACPDLTPLLGEKAITPESRFPFLRYVFQHIVVEFPLLKSGRQDDFWQRCHEFLQEFRKVQLSTYVPSQADASQRLTMMRKLEKTLILALNVGIKTVQGQEESIKVTPDDLQTASDTSSVHSSTHKATDQTTEDGSHTGSDDGIKKAQLDQPIDVNVVLVRHVRPGRFRAHAEFIVKATYGSTTYHVARRHGQFRQLYDRLRADFPAKVPLVPTKAAKDNSTLYREKDRLMLRAYLRRIVAKPKLARHPALFEFLTTDPIQLSDAEQKDVQDRIIADDKRAEQERLFRQEIDDRVVALNDLLEMLKKQVMQPGGLVNVIETIKATELLKDLPDSLRQAFEWGRINFAFTLHKNFVTDDSATENIATLKRTHGFMPYRTMATILKLSNPMAIVKGVLDLFLAQPLGGRSLFQRIILANMQDDAKSLQKDIEALERKIDDPILCAKVANAVSTPLGDDEEARTSGSPMMETLTLLQRDDVAPPLGPEQILKIAQVHPDYKNNAKARKRVKQLHALWVLQARKREQELLMTLVFQGITGELLKELFAIFYQPLAQVYKAANIGESIQHLAAFVDDLLELIDSLDVEVGTNTVEPFVALVQRHEQNFYQFVHRVHAQDTSHLFDELIAYVDHVLSSIAHGILPGERLDLDKTVRTANVPAEAYPALRAEIDALCEHRRQQKLQHLRRTRRKVAGTTAAREDYDDLLKLLPEGIDAMGIIDDIAEIDEHDASRSDDDEDDEIEDEDGASVRSMASSGSGGGSSCSKSSGMGGGSDSALSLGSAEGPKLEWIPKIVPFFVNDVQKMMDGALRQSAIQKTT
ncbi:hypothetical protein BCR43DRAFT_558151 [Syncephalastrum racemosum]|uniref:PX domain-containing protein n=1 Tax=Syncephalastrum racemosum TaxID=13706 RepID=A0A1X2H614_SYNRA|nr:hypothetical protein BCR43DRAFT_558151 [Syncephalastrum racemosum]